MKILILMLIIPAVLILIGYIFKISDWLKGKKENLYCWKKVISIYNVHGKDRKCTLYECPICGKRVCVKTNYCPRCGTELDDDKNVHDEVS